MWARLLVLILLAGVGVARAQESVPDSAVPEPTYTARFADKKVAKLRVEIIPAEQGERRVRITNPNTIKNDMVMESLLFLDSTNQPLKVRVRYGELPVVGEPEPVITDLEAERTILGSWGVSEPARSGVIPYQGNIITNNFSLLFLGRGYDFKRGGAQTFGFYQDFRTKTPRVFNLTLTADGKESIELEGGKVKVMATRMKYSAPDATYLRTKDRTGVLYLGSQGELLACLSPLFNFPMVMSAPATKDADGSISLTLANGQLRLVGTPLSDGWDVKLMSKEGRRVLSKGKLDRNRRILQSGGGWPNALITTDFTPTEIRWQTPAGNSNDVAVTDSKIFLWPHWIVTENWETGGVFALAQNEEQTGTYLPLYDGDRSGRLFTMKRLRDGGKLENGATVHHYRMTSGKNLYDLYTDGARLLFLVGNDGTTITRDGWEGWASKLPALPKPAEEKPASPQPRPRNRRP